MRSSATGRVALRSPIPLRAGSPETTTNGGEARHHVQRHRGQSQEDHRRPVGRQRGEVTNEASFIDDLGADSLDTVELVMALEEEFDIRDPDADAER